MSVPESGRLTKHYSLETLREASQRCFVCKKLAPNIQFDILDNKKIYICARKCFLKFQVYKSARLENIKKNYQLVLLQRQSSGISTLASKILKVA
jgi:hypothetical protein